VKKAVEAHRDIKAVVNFLIIITTMPNRFQMLRRLQSKLLCLSNLLAHHRE